MSWEIISITVDLSLSAQTSVFHDYALCTYKSPIKECWLLLSRCATEMNKLSNLKQWFSILILPRKAWIVFMEDSVLVGLDI